MKKLSLMSLFAALFLVATLANAQCPAGCLFYGGDLNLSDPNQNGLANENDAIVGGNPYGAAVYQNFTLSSDAHVTWMFSNNLSAVVPDNGYWEIRSGISEGNGGTLVASGTSPMHQSTTGRVDFGYVEYQDLVGVDLNLLGGVEYWMAVVPNGTMQPNRSFNSETDGTNSVGSQVANQQYWNSPFLGANFTNASNEGVFPQFSQGLGTPEPSSIVMLGSGLVAAAGVLRRRLSR